MLAGSPHRYIRTAHRRPRRQAPESPCLPRSSLDRPGGGLPLTSAFRLEHSSLLPRTNSSRNRRRLLLRFLQKRHHFAKLLADFFNLKIGFGFTHLLEVRSAGFVLRDPLFR